MPMGCRSACKMVQPLVGDKLRNSSSLHPWVNKVYRNRKPQDESVQGEVNMIRYLGRNGPRLSTIADSCFHRKEEPK